MRRLMKMVSDFLDRDVERERELAYLNGAVSRYDLEARMREVDSGRFRRRSSHSHSH